MLINIASCDEKNMHSILVSGSTTKPLEESKFHQELNLINSDRQHSQTQTRITLNHLQGRPLTQSHNTQELLISLKQVIQAQRTLYLQHGTLHHDISISNILILSTNPPPSPSKSQTQILTEAEAQTQTQAALIDFDHHQPQDLIPSLLGAVHALPFSDPIAIEPPWKYAKEYLELRHPDLPPLDDEVERLLGMYLADGWEIKRLLNLTVKLERGGDIDGGLRDKITPTMLGLLPKDQLIPNPNAPHPHPHCRCPTLPFSSCEYLTGWRVNCRMKPRPPISSNCSIPLASEAGAGSGYTWESWVSVLEDLDSELYAHHWRSEGEGHDVVHEAESLFWILTWVCLAHSSASASTEDDSELEFKRESLRKKLFDSTQYSPVTLGLEKRGVLTGETSQSPTKYFSSTKFNGEPVIKLWKRWRRLIGVGYEMVTFEDVLLGMERVVDNVMEEGQ